MAAISKEIFNYGEKLPGVLEAVADRYDPECVSIYSASLRSPGTSAVVYRALRKYYRITPAGRDRITELLNEWEEIVKVYQFIVTERGESHEQSGISFGTESGA